MELRSVIRYSLAASATFSWAGLGAQRLQGEGVTRDVSTEGAFVLTPSCPPTGAVVRIQILLPSFRVADRSLKLVAEGRVVRVEHLTHGEHANGFAIVSDGFVIPKG